MSKNKLIESLIKEIQEETSMDYDDAKDLLSLLFEKMRDYDNNTVTDAICTDL